MPDQNQGSKLLRRAAWLAAFVIVAAIAAAVWLYPRMFTGPRVPAETSGAGTAGAGAAGNAGDAPTRATPAAPIVFGSVLVNDLRAAEIGPGTPMFVACVIEAHPTATVTVSGLAQVRPLVTAKGREVPLEWDALPPPAGPLAPGNTLTLTWMAKTPPPPGAYDVAVPGATAALRLADAGLTSARIDAASLVVRQDADAPGDAARAARRILALRGRHDELVGSLQAALKQEPDSLSLGRELVNALDGAGRSTEALDELLRLAMRLQQQRAVASPSAPEDLPDWIILGLADLQARARTGAK